VFAALGHGRSYGASSRFLWRTLPGILQCGLWRELEARPPAPTRGLVTDIGNDVLYGFPAYQILEWVDEAILRLGRFTRDIIVTGLPMPSVRRVALWKFLVIRSTLYPSCRVGLAQALATAERVSEALEELALERGAKYFHLDPAWYGFDPIHIRPRFWRAAWRAILGCDQGARGERGSMLEGAALYLRPPERQWLFGVERVTPQTGAPLEAGGRVWLF
jgi:hypothetical protein